MNIIEKIVISIVLAYMLVGFGIVFYKFLRVFLIDEDNK
jgi:hypothetical protein